MSEREVVHASAVLVDGCGVLIRGPAGSGKSSLALALIETGNDQASLIADDQVILTVSDGALVASAPSALSGLLEVRGVGIVALSCAEVSTISLVVDLLPAKECIRLPDEAERRMTLCGIDVLRLTLPIGDLYGRNRVMAALRQWRMI